ncbi:MAG: methyltransferase domain-containing protein [Nitrospira sp.]
MRSTSRLALEFTALEDSQQKILASFTEAAQMRALILTVEAQFPSFDGTGDFTATVTKATLSDIDHRETVRVRVVLPVHIEIPNASRERLTGVVVNFSRGGLCLQTEPFFKIIDETITLHFSEVATGDQPIHRKLETPDVSLTGRIVHLTPDSTVSSKWTPSSPQPVQRVGLRFSDLTPFAEREINRVLAQHIGSSIDVVDPDSGPSIVSDRWECRNTKQQVIAVTADHVRHQISADTPIIILMPGFGSTQTDYVPLSFYLAANHVRVLRYDHSNHVGQSEGSILHITLSHMQTDLRSVLDFVHHTWPTVSVTLLAEDVAARVAVKVMAERRSNDRLFLLNPVLSIDIALATITRSNAIAAYRQGQRRGVINLWGLNVDFDKFVGDAIMKEYVDSASLTAELTQLVTPPVILTSPRTNRPIEHLFGPQQHALRAMGSIQSVVSLPADVTGEPGAYDERRTAAFKTILTAITTSPISSPTPTHALNPNALGVYRQGRLERERIRTRYQVSQATRSALWGTHLAHLSQLENLPDYFALANDFYRWLLPLEPGMTVLDIGCGQRNFHRLLLTNQAYRSTYHRRRTTAPLRYVGLDQSHESLRLAEQQIHLFDKELPGTRTPVISPTQLIAPQWLRTDWNVSLPFTDGSIERILCHLPLSFTPSPLQCLKQMLRVLHPDGTAVVTCFQPHTDLSTLCRRHFHRTDHDEPGSPSQIVLHYLGRLREAILHGFVHAYERHEFTRLLAYAGGHSIQLFSVLDNQLLLAIVRKTKSAG